MAAKRQSVDLRILKRARKRILNKKHWCVGMWAQTKTGKSTDFNSRYADKFCALGSLARAAKDIALEEHKKLSNSAAEDIAECLGRKIVKAYGDRNVGIETINDSYGHKATISAFDKLIAKTK